MVSGFGGTIRGRIPSNVIGFEFTDEEIRQRRRVRLIETEERLPEYLARFARREAAEMRAARLNWGVEYK